MNNKLNFPQYEFKIIKKNDAFYIFDIIRKKYVKLSHEEWVRQHVIHFFIEEKNCPKSLFEIEKKVEVNGQPLRIDALINDKSLNPLILIECKAPNIPINQSVADQIFTYNTVLNVSFLFISNGINHFFYYLDKQSKTIELKKKIPDYDTLLTKKS